MHPVKTAPAIAEAYHAHGVRRFVVDHEDELAKIVAATDGATDLELFVRLAVPGDGAMLTLTGKFGAEPEAAADLVVRAKALSKRVGVTFHVGSQCLDTQAFARAVRMVAGVAKDAGGIDDLDVGGGFPAAYDGTEPDFAAFVAAIHAALAETGLVCRLQCEPGRLLVADGASVLAKVELRRGRGLYLNDGVYGNLAELKWLGPKFAMRRVGKAPNGVKPASIESFDLFGPTCDSIDSMPGPHHLPDDITAGAWIEVGMMGAYSPRVAHRLQRLLRPPLRRRQRRAVVRGGGWCGGAEAGGLGWNGSMPRLSGLRIHNVLKSTGTQPPKL